MGVVAAQGEVLVLEVEERADVRVERHAGQGPGLALELLAGLLTYRAIYYLGPLVLATIAFGVVEARAKKLARPTSTPKA